MVGKPPPHETARWLHPVLLPWNPVYRPHAPSLASTASAGCGRRFDPLRRPKDLDGAAAGDNLTLRRSPPTGRRRGLHPTAE